MPPIGGERGRGDTRDASIVELRVQYALATRAANGVLRLGPWRSYPGEPSLRWSARQQAQGWVLEGAELLQE